MPQSSLLHQDYRAMTSWSRFLSLYLHHMYKIIGMKSLELIWHAMQNDRYIFFLSMRMRMCVCVVYTFIENFYWHFDKMTVNMCTILKFTATTNMFKILFTWKILHFHKASSLKSHLKDKNKLDCYKIKAYKRPLPLHP